MDIIIPIAVKEFYICQKTIRNIRAFFDYETIYIITTKKLFPFFRKDFLNSNRVILLDEDGIIDGLNFASVRAIIDRHGLRNPCYGWYFQQFLKIGFARSKYAKDEYLIWDADTIPLKTIQFKRGGKYLFNLKTEYHVPYFDCIKRILGLEKSVQGSFISEHMVINTSIMKEMLGDIEKKSSSQYGEVFKCIINSLPQDVWFGFSEFETYGTYMYAWHPEKMKFRDLKTLREAGSLYGRGVTKNELLYLTEQQYDTVSFEAGNKPSSIIPMIKDILLRIRVKLLRAQLKHN